MTFLHMIIDDYMHKNITKAKFPFVYPIMKFVPPSHVYVSMKYVL